MKLSSCACEAGTNTMQAAKCSMASDLQSRKIPKAAITSVGLLLSVAILALFCSAFDATPNAELASECATISSTEAEATSTMLAFIAGWLVCYGMKKRHSLVQKTSSVMQSCSAAVRSRFCKATLWLSLAARRRRATTTRICDEIKRNACIVFVSFLCLSCIIGLFVSAFSLALHAEQDDSTEIPTETSQAMKAFTAGWIFVLSLKLRYELTGQLGSSCLLQPF